jgi:DNA-binding response OmpR family regulator
MRTLLITDDQEGVLVALDYVLSQRGYRTLLAKSGAAAVGIAQTEMIDAALVDLHMPGMDGFAVCRSVAAIAAERGRAIPVWVMTAAFTSEAAAKAAECGAIALLKKPFDVDVFLADVERCFSTSQSVANHSPEAGGTPAANAA